MTTREEFDRYFKGNTRREELFLAKGSTLIGDVDPAAYADSGCIYAGARRSGALDHRDADGEHRARGKAAPRNALRRTMLRVGLTGGLGSGKRTVAKMLPQLGA